MSVDLVIDVCHDLINHAMRCDQEESSAMYAQEYRDKEAAIRSVIDDLATLRATLAEVTGERDEARRRLELSRLAQEQAIGMFRKEEARAEAAERERGDVHCGELADERFQEIKRARFIIDGAKVRIADLESELARANRYGSERFAEAIALQTDRDSWKAKAEAAERERDDLRGSIGAAIFDFIRKAERERIAAWLEKQSDDAGYAQEWARDIRANPPSTESEESE